jgi:hypothetical protein
MSKPIKELVEEAQALGVNLHDCPAADIPLPLAEKRKFRAGVVPFEVKVSDGFGFHVIYTVCATSALDARCMAFVLDYGHKTKRWDDGHIERALACTEVVG